MATGDKRPVVMGAEKAVPNGVATLDANGKLAQMPSASDVGALPIVGGTLTGEIDLNGKKFFGEHNKPTGTYGGNNDATKRSIAVGGLSVGDKGEVVTVYGFNASSTASSFAIVSKAGAIGLITNLSANTCEIVSLTRKQASLRDNGTMEIATNSNVLNGDTFIYNWRVQ